MLSDLKTWAEHIVVVSSILSILLPPIETFDHFPRFQKGYALVVVILTRWASLNLRNTIYWRKFSTKRPDVPVPDLPAPAAAPARRGE